MPRINFRNETHLTNCTGIVWNFIRMAAPSAIYVSAQFPPEFLHGSFVETRGSKKKPKAKAKWMPKASDAQRASFFETMWKRERAKQRVAKSRANARHTAKENDVVGIWSFFCFIDLRGIPHSGANQL